MNRYLSSFIISTAVYTFAFVSVLYFLTKEDVHASELPKKTIQSIHFSIVNPEPKHKAEPIPEPILEPKPKPKLKPKTKPKPKPKPKPKFEPKPKLKPKPKLEPKSKPEPEPKLVSKQTNEKVMKQISSNKKISKEPENKKIVDDKKRVAKENLFVSQLRDLIDKNKSYPNSARRRAIEGKVKVSFNILADGNVKSIKILSGKNIFKNSAIKAIEKSFPVAIEKGLFSFPKEFKITLIYTLKS